MSTLSAGFVKLLFAVIICVLGLTVFVAQSSVPGDALYPIKINFNESVISLLTLSDSRQTFLEINQARRRFEELIEVNLEENTPNKILAKANEAFRDQLISTQDRIKTRIEMRQEGAILAAQSLRDQLAAEITHLEALDVVPDRGPNIENIKSFIESIISNLNDYLDDAAGDEDKEFLDDTEPLAPSSMSQQ